MTGQSWLNGLLLGLGGTGRVATDEREQERERQLRALQTVMEQRRLDATAKETELRRLESARQFDAEQGFRREQLDATRFVPSADLLALGVPAEVLTPFGPKVPTMVAQKLVGQAQAAQERGQMVRGLIGLGTRPGAPEAPLPAEGAMYSEAATLTGKSGDA